MLKEDIPNNMTCRDVKRQARWQLRFFSVPIRLEVVSYQAYIYISEWHFNRFQRTKFFAHFAYMYF